MLLGAISMFIYNKFKPTWLMIKRHKITGLLYFCKTAKFDPNKYLGSGKYWWTDGSSEIKSIECPKGWKRGRAPYIKERLFETNRKNEHHLGKNNPSYGKRWWTNGIDTVKSLECPDGWYNGTGSKHREKCKNKVTKS
jgi:hypothetical protein